MEEHYQLATDYLAVSLTKPPRQFGVPLAAYYFNCMICFLGGMLVSSFTQQGLIVVILFVALFLCVHVTMVMMTFRDVFGLHIFWMNLTQFKKHSNFVFWGHTDAFSP